jgi:hypothetical protein
VYIQPSLASSNNMSSKLPHIFIPSQQAMQSTVGPHPTGPMELFMVAHNIELDMKLDARLAATCYSPTLTPSPPPPPESDQSAAGGSKQEKRAKQFPFAVPLVPNVAVKTEDEPMPSAD